MMGEEGGGARGSNFNSKYLEGHFSIESNCVCMKKCAMASAAGAATLLQQHF